MSRLDQGSPDLGVENVVRDISGREKRPYRQSIYKQKQGQNTNLRSLEYVFHDINAL